MPNLNRIFAAPVPTSPEIALSDLTLRLTRRRTALQRRTRDREMHDLGLTEEDIGVMIDLDTALAMEGDGTLHDLATFYADTGTDPLQGCAKAWHTRRAAEVDRQTAHLEGRDAKIIRAAIGKGRVGGVVSRDRLHEVLAELHAHAPWMAPAAAAIQRVMEHATAHGPAPLHTPPLILVGPPGIGKSAWARDVARRFHVPAIDIDIGSTNGAVFAISGTERGWGSAAPGRVVSTILATQVVNPLVIVDELDKLPQNVSSTRGALPGAAEVLKSMIEPTTAKAWTCPYYRMPVNLTRVAWVMTTNSLSGIPLPLLDRCKVVTIKDPTPADLHAATCRMLSDRVPDPDLRAALAEGIATQVLRRRRQGYRTSLRQIARAVAQIEDRPQRVWEI
ncbi:AAA family ATPase [Falsirhodobacter halotolerans]|uniref:AAA family ATPase n=1 Tax=Falsirhodobacter halotolerans TaxID=1146892 RepID=UPI001FD4F585|nr:AAA family ATPase [Falsirhodobacter halotolerans]MCJ8140132.1 AAA family ATPase [Falsirhodobacter halotolerans]